MEMNIDEVQKLPHGLYRIKWKDGGESLAAVGSKYDGQRWICCYGEKIWASVESVTRLDDD
jgi:hypothetical protein